MTVDYQHARDIDDVVFLCAVAAASRHGLWATRWDVACILGGYALDAPDRPPLGEVPGVPWKVVLAKFRRVQGRGLVTGCDCSCRGDFELTDKGRALIMVDEIKWRIEALTGMTVFR